MHRQAGGDKGDDGMGASIIQGDPKRPGIAQLGEQKAQQDISIVSK